ncbi:MAG: hypothetical protein K2Y28_17620 [Burkholderiaceae bacterium]|nr:hypothetical protein [Burkholderiaceae bacterium]
MTLLNWFDGNAAHAFGIELAQVLIERTPVDTAISNKILSKKHESMLNKLEQLIVKFKAENSLNVYKKAKLANAFKWALREKSYDEDYINQVTNWIVLKL